MKIHIPGMKLASTNQLLNEHWSARNARIKQHDRIIRIYWRKERIETPLPCVITLTRISPARYDDDNLQGAFKSIRDTIAQILLGKKKGIADNDPRINWKYDQRKGAPKEYAIEITVAQLGQEQEETKKITT